MGLKALSLSEQTLKTMGCSTLQTADTGIIRRKHRVVTSIIQPLLAVTTIIDGHLSMSCLVNEETGPHMLEPSRWVREHLHVCSGRLLDVTNHRVALNFKIKIFLIEIISIRIAFTDLIPS